MSQYEWCHLSMKFINAGFMIILSSGIRDIKQKAMLPVVCITLNESSGLCV